MSMDNVDKEENISEPVEPVVTEKENFEEDEGAFSAATSSSAQQPAGKNSKDETKDSTAVNKTHGMADSSFLELSDDSNASSVKPGDANPKENAVGSPLPDSPEPIPNPAEEKNFEPDNQPKVNTSSVSDPAGEADKSDDTNKDAENLSSDKLADEAEEKAEEEKKKADFKKWIKSAWLRVIRDCALVILIVIFVYGFFYYHFDVGNQRIDSSDNGDAVIVIETETETEKSTEDDLTEEASETAVPDTEYVQPETAVPVTEPAQPETVIQYIEIEPDPVETENWKDTIFGEESSSLLPNITVTGMTTVQKDRTGFRETDFLYALSDFLNDNNITGVSQINFEEEIMCSSDGATAFRATLIDRPDKVLNVILYPDYPGRYILTLQDAQEVTFEVQTQEQTENSEQYQIQYIYPSQETYPEETLQQDEENSGSEEETTRKYDATTLSVIAIPATLGNYLSNQYELQYTLYDYIYRNGYDADVAEITDYSIDADSRQATIYFVLSDGRSIVGTYDKSTNSYSYH